MEAVDGDADPWSEHLLDRLHVPVPHVGGHLLQDPQQTAVPGRAEPGHERLLVAAGQDLQHAAVAVVDQHAAETPPFFFREISSIPSDRTGWSGPPTDPARRSRYS